MNNTMKLTLLCLPVLMLTMACAHTPPPVAVKPAPALVRPPAPAVECASCPQPSPVPDLLDHVNRLRLASATELQREQQNVQSQMQTANAGQRTRLVIQQALLTSLGRLPADYPRVLLQLEAIQKSSDAQDAPWRSLAALLHALLADQRRQAETLEKQTLALKEEQRRREGMEEREAALQEKLEGLKAIERNLMNRTPVNKP